jgi:methyl-accepting chemotaxis protein
LLQQYKHTHQKEQQFMATSLQQIVEAIGAHGMWKQRIRQAIETGHIAEISIETIRADNQCAFGKWLISNELSASDRQSEYYKNVQRLHTDFHLVAAKVVELATTGKKADAEAMMELGGEYATASSVLTQVMMAWKRNLETTSSTRLT